MPDITGLIATVALVACLVIASVTDLRTRLIPNRLVVGAALTGASCAAFEGRLEAALFWGITGAAPFLAAALIRPEGMGMGDAKLVAVIGLYLGVAVLWALVIGLTVAAMTGVMISLGSRQPPSVTTMPLAPFLALGALVMVGSGFSPLQ